MNDFSADFWLVPDDGDSPSVCVEVGYIVRDKDLESAIHTVLRQRKSESKAWKDWPVFEFDIQKIEFNEADSRRIPCILSGPLEEVLTRADKDGIWSKLMRKLKGRTSASSHSSSADAPEGDSRWIVI